MIYIILHGQTAMNKAKTLQGRSDHPLNSEGRSQAGEAASWFREQNIHIDRVYTSPLIRAVETAQIIAPDIAPVTDRRLIEMDYGPYEGMDLSNPAPEVIAFFMDFAGTPAPAGMEQLNEVVKRSGDFLTDIKNAAAEETILISTHAIAMKGLLEYLTPASGGSYWSEYIGNCWIYASDCRDGAYTVPEKVRGTEVLPGV